MKNLVLSIRQYFLQHILESALSSIYAIICLAENFMVKFIENTEARYVVLILKILGFILLYFVLASLAYHRASQAKNEEIKELKQKLSQRLRPFGINTGLCTDDTGLPVCPHCEKNGIRSYLRREEEHKRYYCMTCNNSQFDSDDAMRNFYAKQRKLDDENSPLGKEWAV